MSALTKFVNPLRQAAAAFFKHDVALKRQPEGLQIVLEARQPGPKPARKDGKKDVKVDVARQKEKQELALVTEQLAALLAEYPEARTTLRHLVFVEGAVRKKGLKVLNKLPLELLQRALEQLEGLVTNWSPQGLANLRSKMAVAVLEREQLGPVADAGDAEEALDSEPHDSLLPPPQPEVTESGYDDAALAAAYAALGSMTPSGEVEFQGELGSRSARAAAGHKPKPGEAAGDIQLRELQG
jgi:hypothetical protein